MAFRSMIRCRPRAVAALAAGGVAATKTLDHQKNTTQSRRDWCPAALPQFGGKSVHCELAKIKSQKGTVQETTTHMKEIEAKANIKQIMKKSKTFECMDDNLLDSVCAISKPLWLKRNAILVEQGEENSTMFIVCHGTLNVLVNGEQVGALDAGSLVGEYSTVNVGKAKATVKVSSRICLVATIAREDMANALEQDQWALFEWLVEEKSKEYLANDFLRTVALFEDASDEFFQDAATLVQYRKFNAGEVMLTAGESDDKGMYIIRTGEASAHIMGDTVVTLGPTDFIGEEVLVAANALRPATVTASTQVDVFAMRRSDFMQLLTKYPKDMMPLRKAVRNVLKKKSTVRVVS